MNVNDIFNAYTLSADAESFTPDLNPQFGASECVNCSIYDLHHMSSLQI